MENHQNETAFSKTMTANRLFETLQFITRTDEKLQLQATLEQIRNHLITLVQSPASTPHQGQLAAALADLLGAAKMLQEAISPSRATAIADLNGTEFFDSHIAERVKASVSTNAMTPSVARDFVTDLTQRRATFLQDVHSTLEGLGRLHIRSAQLPPGTADVSFLIPRDLFDSNFDSFTKELAFISRLMQDVTEGVTGERSSPRLETLSSSIPTISLETLPLIISVIGQIVMSFLDAWERIAKIRKVRDDLKDLNITTEAVQQVEEQVTTTIEEIIEQSTVLVLKNYKGRDQNRKNELSNALTTDIRRLFGQIERGLTVEVRAEPKSDAAEDEEEEIAQVIDLSRTMSFPKPSREPLMLSSAELFEGDLQKRIYKKTTTKTTATKKETKKETKD